MSYIRTAQKWLTLHEVIYSAQDDTNRSPLLREYLRIDGKFVFTSCPSTLFPSPVVNLTLHSIISGISTFSPWPSATLYPAPINSPPTCLLTCVADLDPKDPHHFAGSGSIIFSMDPDPREVLTSPLISPFISRPSSLSVSLGSRKIRHALAPTFESMHHKFSFISDSFLRIISIATIY